MADDSADYFKRREAQELEASDKASDPTIKRLHWEMAQRYAYLASEAGGGCDGADETAALSAGTATF